MSLNWTNGPVSKWNYPDVARIAICRYSPGQSWHLIAHILYGNISENKNEGKLAIRVKDIDSFESFDHLIIFKHAIFTNQFCYTGQIR